MFPNYSTIKARLEKDNRYIFYNNNKKYYIYMSLMGLYHGLVDNRLIKTSHDINEVIHKMYLTK